MTNGHAREARRAPFQPLSHGPASGGDSQTDRGPCPLRSAAFDIRASAFLGHWVFRHSSLRSRHSSFLLIPEDAPHCVDAVAPADFFALLVGSSIVRDGQIEDAYTGYFGEFGS